LGSAHLAAQNVKLMAQYDDLELLGLIRARAQQNQFQHAPQRDVKHRPEHEQTPGSLTKTGHATCTEARDCVYAPPHPTIAVAERAADLIRHGRALAQPDASATAV
jgi:hypothetical protein